MKYKPKARAKATIIDGIKFDSKEEAEAYSLLMSGKIADETGIEELRGAKILSSRPDSITLYPSFKRGDISVRTRKYTPDFILKLKNGDKVHLEYKSKFTESKPDYRLRRAIFLFLHGEKYNFVELIKIKKGTYEYRKYY